MNIGDDDLLGDILSDGSNDSFFDDPKLSTRRTSTVTAKVPDKTEEPKGKTKSDDWLGLGTSSKDIGGAKTASKVKDDWLSLGNTSEIVKETVVTSPPKMKKLVKKISFEDEDDILGTLGLNKKPEKMKVDEIPKESLIQEMKGRKSEFLESILKPSKKDDPLDDILKPASTALRSTDDVKITPMNLNMKHIEDSAINTNLPREGRRRRVTSGLVDPLGLFSNETKNEPSLQIKTDEIKHARAHSLSSSDIKDIDAMSSSKSNFGDASRSVPNLLEPPDLPGWLGGSSKSKSSETDWGGMSSVKSKSELTLSDKTDNVAANEANNENTQAPRSSTEQVINEHSKSELNFFNSFLAHQKMAQSQMDYQNTSISLQQQESQVLMALQMKKYEDNLMEIQRQQQQILLKQEQQFSALLEKQFAKQHAMENNMRLQQERINSHIQLLLSQPRVDAPVGQLKEEIEKTKQSAEEEHIKAYESIINNLKQRQREELFILEESYKKQISVLEDTTNNTETRMKTELIAALSRNEENIKLLEENHEKELDKFKKKIEEIEEQHAKEMKQIRENHMRVIDEIKYEHNIIIDNIKESKRSEASVLQDSGEFGKKLEANIQLLYNNSHLLQNVCGKIETDYGVVQTAREETLKAKEKEIGMMRSALDKCRESAEMERVQMFGLVRSLETKIADQSQAAREERWALQQAVSTLSARSAAFDREMEFSKSSIEREREQLKALRESMLAEQEKVMLQLTEEKLTISAERSRLEISSKLNVQYDSQKAKAELEAAIQVAKEATEMTDKERESLQKQIIEVESLKRTLQDKQRKLISREAELSQLAQISEQKYQEGEKALEDSKMIEMRSNERMKHLQFQLLQLSNREKKITEEKIALSKERIALNTLMRQRRSCSLCAADAPPQTDEPKGDWNSDLNTQEVTPFLRFDMTEADIFRLQFEDKEENLNTAFKNL